MSLLYLAFFVKSVSIKSILFILFVIALTSLGSIVLLLFYMNPLPAETRTIAFSLMGLAVFLAGSSLLAPMIFFIKKIYYRGDISTLTLHASVRQAILITFGLIAMVILYFFRILEPKLIAMVWATIGCLEVMIQAIE